MIARLREIWARLQLTLPLRAWQRYGDLRGNRLAGASSFYGFVSLFPLLVLGAAVVSAVAGASGVQTMQEIVDENLPGLGIRVETFYRNAGTIGVIGAGTLLFTGLGWVDSVRAAVRSMWGVDDQPGNIVVRKALDVAALVGLGVLIAVSWGASVVLGELAADLLELLGFDGPVGRILLWTVSATLSIGVSALLFAYLLTGLPRIVIPTRSLIAASLLGAVVFEILKQFLVQYVAGPASRSAYAAFAAPLAMLAWIYLVTRLLMLLAALTAESAIDRLDAEVDASADVEAGTEADTTGSVVMAGSRNELPRGQAGMGVSGAGFVAGGQLDPALRQARAVGIASGVLLGAAGVGLALLASRAVKALAQAVGRDKD